MTQEALLALICLAVPVTLHQGWWNGQGLTCGAGWSAAEHKLLRLCQCDVTPVSERGDAQTSTVPNILVPVHDLGIADVHL